MSLRTRAGEVLKGLVALVALAMLVAIPPWALARYVGWPLPSEVPAWDELTDALNNDGIPDAFLIRALAVVVWVTWLGLVISLAAETAASARGRAAHRIPAAGLIQPLVARLVATVAIAVLAALPRTEEHPAAQASLASYLQAPPAATAVVNLPAPAPHGEALPAATSDAAKMLTHTVVRGDTLWALAEAHLGDPFRWPEIWELNAGSLQPDGRTFEDPHWIYPGWRLQLPADNTPTPAAPEPPPAQPSSTALAVEHPAEAIPPPPTTTPPPPTSTPELAPEPATPSNAAAPNPAEGWLTLESGARIGSGFAAGVLAAMGLNKLRSRRHYQPRTPSPRPSYDVPASPPLRDLITASQQAGLRPRIAQAAEAATIDVAMRDGHVMTLDLSASRGLHASGPGAEAAARAWASELATHRPEAAEIITTTSLARRLFGDCPMPNVQVKAEGHDVLSRLEAAGIGRTRLCDEEDLPDLASVRDRLPQVPLPTIIAITEDDDPSLRARWHNVLATGSRLGITALQLTRRPPTSPAGLALHIDGDGTIKAPEATPHRLDGAVALQLDPGTAAALLEPIVTAQQHDIDHMTHPGSDPTDPPAETRPEAAPPAERPVSFRALGPLRIEVEGAPITKGLRTSSLELLAWYALHPNGASQERAIDTLWPDLDLTRGRERFWSALGTLRRVLRTATGLDDLDVLVRTRDRYEICPDTISIDLWRFEQALQQAAQASGESEEAALAEAADLYQDAFADGHDALWIDPIREDLHRRALDTLSRLAKLQDEAGRNGLAQVTLERAITLDPYFEHAYRHLIAVTAAAGHPEAAQHVWQRLQERLADLDVDPDPATVTAVREALSPPTSVGTPVAPRH